MKGSLILLTSTAALIILAAYTSSQNPAVPPHAVLKVLSAQEGREVRFEGKYFNTGQESFHQEAEVRTTPFEVAIDANEFVALFRSLDEETKIKLSVQINGGGQTVSAQSIAEVGLILRDGMKLTSGGL